jgi:hypothetical protein
MLSLIPHRYNTPKWLARVPAEKAFVFKDGSSVRSLFDLKQALMSLSEDTVVFHLDPNRHDIASWIRHTIGDDALADDIGKQFHRWGLIVSLERGLMRTLNMPGYVAKRWLEPAPQSFTFISGQTVQSLDQLLEVLKTVDDGVIAHHKERVPNDISVWINNMVGDYELADMLEEASNRQHMINILEDHLVMLRDGAQEN